MMSQPLCRWGILSTANIARKNWQAIHNAGNSALVAVASRDISRARQFIEECQASVPLKPAPVPCGSYEELLERSDIDAVYIPLPTALRKDWVLRAAQAGKHILCEKPCGVSSEEVRAMLEACRKNKVQFMDGVMFMHSRRLPLLRQLLDDPQAIGDLRRIVSHFSFGAGEEFLMQNIRSSSDLEPLGCLGDLGWYNVRFSLWVLQEQLPERVTGCLLSQQGRGSRGPVPMEFSGELFFAGGVSASFYCSFRTEIQQWANVGGTRGYLTVPDFVLPFYGSESVVEVNNPVYRVQCCDHHMENHPRRFAVAEYSDSDVTSQEANMIRTFAEMVRTGRLEPKWGEIALKTQQVVDACLQSAREEGRSVRVG